MCEQPTGSACGAETWRGKKLEEEGGIEDKKKSDVLNTMKN